MKKASLYQRSGAFFVSVSFARRYRQMMRFIKKNVYFICIFDKKIVILQDNSVDHYSRMRVCGCESNR